MANNYICKGCNKGCERGTTHKCGETCSDCKSVPPCTFSERVPCESCNRNFRSRSCFEKHKTNKLGGNMTVCEKVRNCHVCKACVTRKNHECFKPYCPKCNKNMEINYLCYMQPLKNELPCANDVLFVFYDFETTQDTKISETVEYMSLSSFAFSNSVRPVRWKTITPRIARGAVRESIRSLKTLLAICFRT